MENTMNQTPPKEKNKKANIEEPKISLTKDQIIDVFAIDGGINFRATIESGNIDVSDIIPFPIMKDAYDNSMSLIFKGEGKFEEISRMFVEEIEEGTILNESFIKNSFKYKPKNIFISELKWKYLIRNVIKCKNTITLGATGSAKTTVARIVAKVLKRPFFNIPLGSTQDPRSSLIGNTFFNKSSGTYFDESRFVKAIRTPNAVILLDELSRAHPEAWNILMPVLDEGQRHLLLDEKDGQEIVKVAKGVSFIATANIGVEYTSTRVFDRALLDRFSIVEMDLLNANQELQLLQLIYPKVEVETLETLANIAHEVREEWLSSSGKLSTGFSTRMSVEVGEMLQDGFTLFEALEVTLFPLYDKAGGENSERTFLSQLVQKYIKVDEEENEDLFQTDTKISADNPF